jgi:deoxyribonuclease-4
MQETLKNALAHATPDCPLLLETPAGQGTELLRGAEEFMDFVESFGDQRLRACLDTCHVFACGHKPLEYLGKMRERAGLLKLVHYNDSAAPCGSCVDRHAYMGTGHIGMEGMKAIAELCTAGQVPMVIE